jgi:cytochrome c
MRLGLLISAAILAIPSLAQAQDVASGEKVFAQCKACHQIGENAKNAVGPILNGLIGRKAGTIAGYTYSQANKNSGITWDDETFTTYIKDPKAKVPGTKMIFPGVKDEQKVKDLLAYLKQFDAAGHQTAQAQ